MSLLIVAVVLVVLGLWLRRSLDEVVRYFGVICIACGLGLAAVAFFVGCSSPTAPTSTRLFGWAAAPGCAPDLPIVPQRGEPVVTLHVPGSPLLQAVWVTPEGGTVTVTFKTIGGGMFLVCSVGAA